jgi:glycine cleavage system H protein
MGPSSKSSANTSRHACTRSPLGTVPAESKACIWMRAGVLSYRLCDREFDCEHCLLDKALHGGDSESATAWTPGEWGPSGYRLFPQDRHFSPTHTWVLPMGSSSVRLGLDALVAWLLSEATGIELPAVGTRLERGKVAATVFTKGGKLTIPAPISGEVSGHNEVVQDCPELVVSAPYGAGWLVDMTVESGRKNRQLTQLLCGPDMETLSRSHLHSFHHRTDELIAARPARVGATMADGGKALTDPRAILGPARYLKLVQELLT